MENTTKSSSVKKKIIIALCVILVIVIAAYFAVSIACKPDIKKCNITKTTAVTTYKDLPSGILSNINTLDFKNGYTYSSKLDSNKDGYIWYEYKSNSDSEVTVDVGVTDKGNTKEVLYKVQDINKTVTTVYEYTIHGNLTSITTESADKKKVIKFADKKFYSEYTVTQKRGYYYCTTYDKDGKLICSGVWSKLPGFFMYAGKNECYDSSMNPISLDEYNAALSSFNS